MKTTIKYILLTALRDRLFAGLFVAIIASFGLSLFVGQTAIVEEMQMGLVYMAGSTRIVLLIGLIVFVCFHVRRAFDNREIEVMLSRPISRSGFIVAYWLGFVITSILLIIPFAALIFWISRNLGGTLIWTASFFLETSLVLAFAIFASMILRSAVTAVLLCFAFYFISRLLGFFIYILDKPVADTVKDIAMNGLLKFISMIVPRLDLFSQSKWLVYGVPDAGTIAILVVQAGIYIPFLLFVAMYDFKRKQF